MSYSATEIKCLLRQVPSNLLIIVTQYLGRLRLR